VSVIRGGTIHVIRCGCHQPWNQDKRCEDLTREVDYAIAAPIQAFGCWLKSWEEPDQRYRPPTYWVGGRCAAGCHMIEYRAPHELMDDFGYLDHLVYDVVQRLAIAHAGLK